MQKILLIVLLLLGGHYVHAQYNPNFKAPIQTKMKNWVHGPELKKLDLITAPMMDQGVLFWADAGKKIFAIQDGQITRILPQKNGCFAVLVTHKNGWRAKYEGVTTTQKEGSSVTKGKRFAQVCQPTSEPSYFYFELRENKRPVNSFNYIHNKP